MRQREIRPLSLRKYLRLVSLYAAIGFLLVMTGPVTWAQEGKSGDGNSDLAKQAQNPVADLISVPFQNNTGFGMGPHNRVQNSLNIQPVIPFNLNNDWNLITRTIAPIMKQPDVRTTNDDVWGLGDISFSAFLSPAQPGKLIWGVGTALLLPTGTNPAISTRKWSAGPSAVVLKSEGPWVFGALAQNVWSFAGRGSGDPNTRIPDVNQFYSQLFLNYNLPDGWYLSSAPIITANWDARSDNKWTVPVGGGFGKVFKLQTLPMNASLQAYANVIHPENGPDWTLRCSISFLFPKSMFTN